MKWRGNLPRILLCYFLLSSELQTKKPISDGPFSVKFDIVKGMVIMANWSI